MKQSASGMKSKVWTVGYCLYLLIAAFSSQLKISQGVGRIASFSPKIIFLHITAVLIQMNFTFKGANKDLEIGVFNMNDGESGLISTYPGYSDILWPPPNWIFPDAFSCGWRDGGDKVENDREACSSKEACPASLTVEVKSQSIEDPSAINSQEQSNGTGASTMQFQRVDVPWSDIPSKLLTEIAKHLKTRIDVCQFRAVSKKWRISCPLPQNSNLLCSLLPHKISTTSAPFIMSPSSTASNSLIMVASTVYLLQPCHQSLGPSKSWLLTVEELNPGKLFLRLPLRRAAIEELPKNFPRVLDLSYFHVTEISKEYNFRYANNSLGMFSSHNWWSFSNSHKVVLLSDSSDDTTALVLYDRGNLVLFRLRDDDNWMSVHYGSVTKFDDMVNIKGKIYAIDRKGQAYFINCDTSKISRITVDAMGTGISPDRQKCLVESHGELYLLVRHSPEDKIYFKVYKLNEEQHKWNEIRSLGDKILFVTPTFCFVASVQDFPRWKGNCIVFPPDCLPANSRSTCPDWRFFRRKIEELRIGVFYLGDHDGAKLITNYSGYSDLFWPPPAWLQPLAFSSRNENNQMNFPNTLKIAAENSSMSAQQDSSAEKIVAHNLTPDSNSPVQVSKDGASTINFQGVEVRSELVPILQQIWEKYGNIAEGSEVHNHSPGTVARALESLAEAVAILKSASGRSLDQSQTSILCATFSNLVKMRFRVDWLAPFVDKALTCQRSNVLASRLRELESMKAQLVEMIRQHFYALAEIQSKLDDETRSVTDDISSLGPIHLDLGKCLGEGLC